MHRVSIRGHHPENDQPVRSTDQFEMTNCIDDWCTVSTSGKMLNEATERKKRPRPLAKDTLTKVQCLLNNVSILFVTTATDVM